jgi:hypothetical protein
VVVGDDEAFIADQNAGTQRALHALARLGRDLSAEKFLEQRVLERKARPLLRDDARGVDVDDGGRDALDERRIGQLHIGLAGGNGTLLRTRRNAHQRDRRENRAEHENSSHCQNLMNRNASRRDL